MPVLPKHGHRITLAVEQNIAEVNFYYLDNK